MTGMTDDVERVARAICKSRTCEGYACCQWPAQGGRTNCPVKNGGYDDAARAAIAVLSTRAEVVEECARAICPHCKADVPFGKNSFGRHGHVDERNCWRACEAAALRSLAPSHKEKDDV